MTAKFPRLDLASAEYASQVERELIAAGFPPDIHGKKGPGPLFRRTSSRWVLIGGIPAEIYDRLQEKFPQPVSEDVLFLNSRRILITSDKPAYLPKVRQGASPRVFCFSVRISSIEFFRAFREEYYAHKGHLGWNFFQPK